MLTTMHVNIRWTIRADMPEVNAIEDQEFPWSWSEAKIIAALRQRSIIGMVAETTTRRNDIIVAHMLYELRRSSIVLRRLVVHQDYRKRGLGRLMLASIQEKLEVLTSPRNRVLAAFPEINTQAACFFRACGFVGSLHDDQYVMEWRVKKGVTT